MRSTRIQDGRQSLVGKTAIVTGGALGIGWGVVQRFSDAGANILLVDSEPEYADDRLSELGGVGEAACIKLDVTAERAGDTAVETCLEHFGSVDVLVNNAGIYPHAPMLGVEPDVFRRVIDVNLVGLAFMCQAVARHLVATERSGKIINISSIDAFHPSRVGLAAYDASKAGVVMLTKSLALELAPYGINVNSVAPGGVKTEGAGEASAFPPEMTSEEVEDMLSKFVKARIPLGRMGAPDDVAKVVLFLASSGADYITGENIVVDGGSLLS